MALELGPAEATGDAGEHQPGMYRAALSFVDQRIFGGMFLSPMAPDVPAVVAVVKLRR